MISRRLTVALAAAAMAVALLPVAGSAQEEGADVTVEASRQVSTSANPVRLFAIPEVAVHPDNANTLAMIAGDARNGGCYVYMSRDGGLSWSSGVNVAPADNPFCLQRNFGPGSDIKWASDGTLYAAFSGSSVERDHPNGATTAYLARSGDGGRTFETFVVSEGVSGLEMVNPRDDETVAIEEVKYLMSLAVDPNNSDQVYVGWKWRARGDGARGIPNGTQLAVSSDGGATFGEPIDLGSQAQPLESYHGSDTAMIAVDSQGTVHVVAQERPAEDPEHLLYWRSTDQGATWQAKTIANVAANDIDSPDIAIDTANDNIYVVLGVRTEPEDDPENGWIEVMFTASTDGGETWSDARNISTDPDGYSAYFPGVAVAPNGRVDVAWHDFRDDPFFTPGEVGFMGSAAGQKYSDIYYAYSTDSGANWSQNIRVSDRSMNREVGITFANSDFRGPVGISSSNAAANITWADTRAADPEQEVEDVYMTRVRHSADVAAPATSGADSNSVLWSVLGGGAALALGGLVLLIGTRRARRSAPKAGTAPARGGSD